MGLFNFMEKKVTLEELSAILRENLERVAFRELAIHIAISYIANTLSKCEFKVYENGAEVKNRLYYLLNVNPNPNENSSQFINHFIENYYYKGGALLFKHGSDLQCADSFDVDNANPLKPFEYKNIVCGTSGQLRRTLRASDVFHIKLDNREVKKLVDAVNIEYGKVADAAIKCFKRTNNKKYKYLLDQYQAGDGNFKKLYEEQLKGQLEEFLKSEGDAVLPKYNGIDLVEFSATNPQSSADIVSIRKEMFEVTAQGFLVPLPLLYGNMTNLKDIVSQFLTFCIDPLGEMIGEEITRKSYSFDEWNRGCFVRVDSSSISHVEMLEVADKVDKLVSSGVLCIDELRGVLGFNALNTEFSREHFMTKNYEPAGNALVRVEDQQ